MITTANIKAIIPRYLWKYAVQWGFEKYIRYSYGQYVLSMSTRPCCLCRWISWKHSDFAHVSPCWICCSLLPHGKGALLGLQFLFYLHDMSCHPIETNITDWIGGEQSAGVMAQLAAITTLNWESVALSSHLSLGLCRNINHPMVGSILVK